MIWKWVAGWCPVWRWLIDWPGSCAVWIRTRTLTSTANSVLTAKMTDRCCVYPAWSCREVMGLGLRCAVVFERGKHMVPHQNWGRVLFIGLLNFARIVGCSKQYVSCKGILVQCMGKRRMLETLQWEELGKYGVLSSTSLRLLRFLVYCNNWIQFPFINVPT